MSGIVGDKKKNMIRLLVLQPVVEELTQAYTEDENIDKKFLAELRQSRTRLNKAIELQCSSLGKEISDELIQEASKLQVMVLGEPESGELQPSFVDVVPTEVYTLAVSQFAAREAHLAEYKQELIDILYLEDDRPENLSMEEIIACLRQTCHDFEKQDREQMEEIRELRGQINILQGILAGAEGRIDDLEKQAAEYAEAAAAAQEVPKEEYPVSIGLASGGEFEYVLPAAMTEAMIREIQQPRHSRSTCAQYAGGRLVAIDLQEVVAIHVDKLPQGDWVKKKAAAESNVSAQSELERYRVECKCGSEYFADMNTGRSKAWCRTCKGAVFADRQADKVTDPSDGVEATLLTNLYWVERDPKPSEPKRDLPVSKINQNFGKQYKDPCNPFERTMVKWNEML